MKTLEKKNKKENITDNNIKYDPTFCITTHHNHFPFMRPSLR